jgi:hypothetical protein
MEVHEAFTINILQNIEHNTDHLYPKFLCTVSTVEKIALYTKLVFQDIGLCLIVKF